VQAASLQLGNAGKLPTLRIGFVNSAGSRESPYLRPTYYSTDKNSVKDTCRDL